MNKRTNKELQFTSVMPTMKKSLLALAIAGTMSMSGGAYAADNDIIVNSSGSAQFTVTSATINTDSTGVIVTGTSAADANTTSLIKANSSATIETNDAAGTLGAIVIAETADAITISNVGTTDNSVLTIGAVTGLGILNITGTNSTGTKDVSVIATDIGASGTVLAELNVTGSGSEAASLTISDDSFVTATKLVGVSGAAATLTIAGASATLTGAITLDGQAADQAIVILGGASTIATVTGNINTTSGDFGTVTIAGDTTITGDILTTGTTTINLSADKTLTMGASNIISDSVTTTTDGTGTLVFTAAVSDATATVATNIGTSAKKLKAVTITATDDGSGNSEVTSTISGNVYATTVTATATAAYVNATTDGDIVAFGGVVEAATITVAGAGTVTFAGNVVATTALDFGSTDGVASIAANRSLTGVVTSTNNKGTLTFGTTTANMTLANTTIGTSAADDLLAVNIVVTDADLGDSTGVTATMGGNIFAATVTATATAATDGEGDGDTVAFSGTVGADTLALVGAGNFTFADTVTAATAVTVAGDATLTVAANKGIVGAVQGANNLGTLTFATTTASTTLASTLVGQATNDELKAVNITATDADLTDGVGVVATMGGNIWATTVNATATVATDADGDGDTVAFSGTVIGTTLNLDGAGKFTFADTVTAATVISGDSTLTFAAQKNIVGAVTNDSGAAAGTLAFSATAGTTIVANAALGATTAAEYLKAVNITVNDANDTDTSQATLSGAVFATTVTADASASHDTVLFSGNVSATTLNLDGAGVFTLNGTNTAATVISGDSTTTVGAAGKFVGAVTNDGTTGEGTLTFAAHTADGDQIKSNSTIGSSSKALKAVNITQTVTNNTAGSSTFSGAIHATTVTATTTDASNDTIVFSDTVNATTLNLDGAGIFTLGGDVTAIVDFGADATATVAANKKIVGIVTGVNNTGTLTFATTTASTTLASTHVGQAADDELKALNIVVADAAMANSTGVVGTIGGNVFATTVNATATLATDGEGDGDTVAFNGTVTATTLNVAGLGTVTAAENVTAAVVLADGTDGTGTFSVAANKIVAGSITTATAGDGTATFAEATTDVTLVNGAVGAAGGSKLFALNAAAASGKTATFGSTIDATTVTIAGAGTVAVTGAIIAPAINISANGTLDATGAITGAVDNTSGADGSGTLTLAADMGVSGAVGTTKTLLAVNLNAATGNTATMGGIVKATNINLAGVGTKAFQGNVTGIVTFTADGLATVTVDEIIVGSIATSTTDTGTITFDTSTAGDTTLVSGNIGASGKLLKKVVLDAAAGDSATIGGDIYATLITVDGSDGTGIINFNGHVEGTTLSILGDDAIVNIAANKNLTAATTVVTDGEGTLNFAGGNTVTGLVGVIGGTDLKVINIDGGIVTFKNNIAADTVTIDTTTTLKTTSAISINSNTAINNSGTMDVGATLTLAGEGSAGTTAVDFGAHASTSKMTLAKASAYTSDVVIDATDTSVDTNATNAVEVTPHATFISGTLTLVDNDTNGGSADDVAKWTFVNNSLATYADSLGAAGAATEGDVIVTATSKTDAAIASALSITTNQAAALKIAAGQVNGTTSSATAFNTAMQAGGSTATNAAEKITPDAGAAMGSALAAVSGVNNVIAGRQTNTRVAFNARGNQSGISTGDPADDLVVWGKIFGSTATQDKVGTVDGYEADSTGLALGWETDKSGDLWGLSISFSDADVDGKSAAASHTDTEATQVSVYGTYGKATDWMIGYASGDNDTKRTTLDGTASGKYDSGVTMAKIGHAFASSQTGGWTMTPKADLSWTNINNDGYTETGANAFNLIVASSSNNISTARVGAEFTQRTEDNGAVTIPHFNIMAGYDLKNDGGETSSTFTGGGSAFTTKGADTDKASLQLGFGVDHVSDDSTVSLDLNADLRSDYDSMSGSLTFKSKF